jgi:hypothetical protein
VLLGVPLALSRRRLGWEWFIPLALWLTPTSEPRGHAWRMLLGLAVTAAVWAAAHWSLPTPRLRRVRGTYVRMRSSYFFTLKKA